MESETTECYYCPWATDDLQTCINHVVELHTHTRTHTDTHIERERERERDRERQRETERICALATYGIVSSPTHERERERGGGTK